MHVDRRIYKREARRKLVIQGGKGNTDHIGAVLFPIDSVFFR